MSKDSFQTKDLGEASALLCSDFPIKSVAVQNQRCWFNFEAYEQAKNVIERYWSHKLQVDAQDFFHATNRLKVLIFERTR